MSNEIDLLAAVENGLPEEDAYAYIEGVLASGKDVLKYLCLTRKEYTAFMHGAPPAVLANWRYGGWPATCSRCGRPLESEAYRWLAREQETGNWGLEHVDCDALASAGNHHD